MKKSYMKPEVNEIEVAANQAVAACQSAISAYRSFNNRSQTASSPEDVWAMSQHIDYSIPPYSGVEVSVRTSPETAFNSDYVFPIYTITGINNSGRDFKVTIEDLDCNGKYSSKDNIQDQHDDALYGLKYDTPFANIVS